ncbi:MAG: response regulator transcription factor [Sphaerochaeta sp.]|jgi:DNA-binding response OmpR family regulator|nr:response regulator transcription factor [Sphaerochaeta sp.]
MKDEPSKKIPVIYIIEDHDVLREGVKQYLELSGFKVEGFATLAAARPAFTRLTPDLLIQDVMLPDGDGFSFVKQLKTQYEVPVIFMTARTEESDKILGFELGADDYISKPFSPKELVMRVKAVLRRTEKQKNGEADMEGGWFYVQDHSLDFDEVEHTLTCDGKPVILTAAEWRILACLIHNHPQLISRAQILEQCFDYSFDSYDRIVDTHIKNIRGKLGDGAWIETVRGYGYRFVGHRKG